MSVPLPTVNLASAVVGTTGTVNFSNAGPTASLKQYSDPAHIQIYNESGCGLQITFQNNGNGYFVPAGGWLTLPMAVGESGYSYYVTYVLNNAPVSQLYTVYYAPGENIPSVAILGNSPIGGATNVSGSITANSVFNHSDPVQTEEISLRVPGDTNDSVAIYNNGLVQLGGPSRTAHIVFLNNSQLLFDRGDGNNYIFEELTIASKRVVNLFCDNNAASDQVLVLGPSFGGTEIDLDWQNGQIKIVTIATAVNGSVSGTATLYQDFTGTVKRTKLFLNNYKDGGTKTLTLPVAYTGPSSWTVWDVDSGNLQAKSSGVSQTFSVLTALALAGGTQSPATQLGSNSIAMCRAGFDSIAITINTTAVTSIVDIEGI